MPDETVEIEELADVTEEHERAMQRLVPQLSSSVPPRRLELEQISSSDASRLLIARLSGEIVGMTAVVVFVIPTGRRAIIEDVVVDESARGHGIGAALVKAALRTAEGLGARTVDLTSRPSRLEANRLYERLGFDRRQTNVYRYQFKSQDNTW